MTIFSHLDRYLDRFLDHLSDRSHLRVSRACIEHHERHAITRGVDLPRWKTPAELQRTRIAEARKLLLFAKTKRSA